MCIQEYNRKSDWIGVQHVQTTELSVLMVRLDQGRTTEPPCIQFNRGGGAFNYVACLASEGGDHLPSLIVVMQQWFGNHIFPETCWATLLTSKRFDKEHFREYEVR